MPNISEFLAQTKLPEPALAPITQKVDEFIALVQKSNGLVAQINAAKAQDPNNVEFLDARWRANETDPKIAETVQRFDVIAEEYEKLLKVLRDNAKEHFIPEALDEEASKAAKKTVNEMAPAIGEARKAAAAMLTIPESILSTMKVELPEGGLVTLLPVAESLKNIRGRKASTASGEVRSYATRIGEGIVDGKSTNRDGNGKFAYVADAISEKFNAGNIAANKVTKEEIEEAYFKSLPGSPEFRSLSSAEIPKEHSFVFEKTINVKNTNDDGYTEIPQKVRVTIRSNGFFEQAKPETEKVEDKPAENKTEAPQKIDTRTEAQKAKDAENKAPESKTPAKK